MQTPRYWVVVAILLTLPLAVKSQAVDQLHVEKPDIHVGDQWTFRRVDLWTKNETSRLRFEVYSVKEDDVRLIRSIFTPNDSDDAGRKMNVRADRATWTFRDPSILDGKYIALPFPLHAGKTWNYEFVYKLANDNKLNKDCEAKVQGRELATVPAGEFDTIKVAHSCTWRSSVWAGNFRWGGRSSEVYWYAPAVRQTIRHEWQYSFLVPFGNGTPYEWFRDELVAYSIKEDAPAPQSPDTESAHQ